MLDRRFGLPTATLLVVASMVGTGVFTTTGFLVRDIGSSPAVLCCWALGAVAALAGAISYAELAAALPKNGGEYLLLSRIYHPALGFTAGWITLVVGFSAPIAAAALAYAAYLAAVIPGLPELPVALSLIAILSGLHGMRVELGAGFQNAFTFGKVLLILAFVVGGLLLGEPSRALEPGAVPFGRALLSPGFAVGLVFVSYAYQGWNASFYVAEELREPTRWLPLSLVVGTSLVAALYLGLNAVFLGAVPAGELSGVEAVAHVASVALFGQRAAGVLSVVIAVGLVSTVGAYVMTGPRVLEAMGRRSPALRALGGRGRGRGPVPAIALQGILATGMALYARLDALLAYAGFTLSLVAALAVAGVPVLRWREPDLPRPYRCWGYPVTPWLFVALALWMAGHAAVRHPGVALAAAATVGLGLGLWWVIEGRKAG